MDHTVSAVELTYHQTRHTSPVCATCYKSLDGIAAYSSRKYCSNRCRQKAYRLRHAPTLPLRKDKNTKKPILRPLTLVLKEKYCLFCNTPLQSIARRRTKCYCSSKCRQIAYRRRASSAQWEHISPHSKFSIGTQMKLAAIHHRYGLQLAQEMRRLISLERSYAVKNAISASVPH